MRNCTTQLWGYSPDTCCAASWYTKHAWAGGDRQNQNKTGEKRGRAKRHAEGSTGKCHLVVQKAGLLQHAWFIVMRTMKTGNLFRWQNAIPAWKGHGVARAAVTLYNHRGGRLQSSNKFCVTVLCLAKLVFKDPQHSLGYPHRRPHWWQALKITQKKTTVQPLQTQFSWLLRICSNSSQH